MSATVGDLKHAAQAQFVRAQKAEEKAEDAQHALNLLLNFGFERFHMALTSDGAVHRFELGNCQKSSRVRRDRLAIHPGESTQSADRSLEDDVPPRTCIRLSIPRVRIPVAPQAFETGK